MNARVAGSFTHVVDFQDEFVAQIGVDAILDAPAGESPVPLILSAVWLNTSPPTELAFRSGQELP